MIYLQQHRNGSYFILNKSTDYAEGSGFNIEYLSPGIKISEEEERDGYYFTKLFDSYEKKTGWQQMLVEGSILSEASVSFYIYTSETEWINTSDGKREIKELLREESISVEKKMILFEKHLALKVRGCKDVLLHQVTGRYLWLLIHLKMQGDHNPAITKVKLVFPKKSLMNFLPDVYQENPKSASFLERYLEIFDTLYSEVNDRIRDIAVYFDPDATPEEFLQWMAEWIAIEDVYMWNEEQLRFLLKNATRLYKIRGTRQYLEEMIGLYTGRKPYIVENHALEKYKQDLVKGDNLEQLYGAGSFVFTVIVNLGRKVSEREYQILTRLINAAKPAYMGCRLVVLEPYIYLGKHSYLGINSVLGNYALPVIDSKTSLAFIKLEKKEENGKVD